MHSEMKMEMLNPTNIHICYRILPNMLNRLPKIVELQGNSLNHDCSASIRNEVLFFLGIFVSGTIHI